MIWVASSKHRSMLTARMWKRMSPGVATARCRPRISRKGCNSFGRCDPKSLAQASEPNAMTHDRRPSRSRKPTARRRAARSPQTARTAARCSGPGFTVTTRKMAAGVSGATTGCGIAAGMGDTLLQPRNARPAAVLRARHLGRSLPFDGADAGGAAVDLDTAGDPELFTVEAQYIDGLGQHPLRQERLAVLAPCHALGPTPDLGLRGEGELGAVDAIDHEEAALVVGLVGLWPLRPVLDGDGHVRAVGREHSGLGDLAHRDGIDDARWVLLQIDDGDYVGVTLAAPLVGEHRHVAPGADGDAVGADAGNHIRLGVLDLDTVDAHHGDAMIAVAGHQRTLAVGGERHVAGPGLRVAKHELADHGEGLPCDGQDRHGALAAIGDQG